jgi:fructosamine-3-kinase
MRWLLEVPVTWLSVAGAQHGYQHLTATLADGRTVFAKAAPGAGQAAAFAAEANGLRWLAQARSVPVPRVLGVAEDLLVLELLTAGRPTAEAAAGFGASYAGQRRTAARAALAA